MLLFAHSLLSMFLPKPLPIRVISHLPDAVVTPRALSWLLCRTCIIACPVFALFFGCLSSLSVVGSLSLSSGRQWPLFCASVPGPCLLCCQPSPGVYTPDLSPESHACTFRHPRAAFLRCAAPTPSAANLKLSCCLLKWLPPSWRLGLELTAPDSFQRLLPDSIHECKPCRLYLCSKPRDGLFIRFTKFASRQAHLYI